MKSGGYNSNEFPCEFSYGTIFSPLYLNEDRRFCQFDFLGVAKEILAHPAAQMPRWAGSVPGGPGSKKLQG